MAAGAQAFLKKDEDLGQVRAGIKFPQVEFQSDLIGCKSCSGILLIPFYKFPTDEIDR